MAKRNGRRGFNNRVVAYLRYSTQNQNELSIEYQREEVDKYCDKLGYIIVKYFVDEAKSATNDKREAFDSMIKEAMNEPTWSKIIVFSFNLKKRSRMFTYRANFWCLFSYYDISTNPAFPNSISFFTKYQSIFYIF